MGIFRRSGTLIFGSVVALCILAGCATTNDVAVEEPEEEEVSQEETQLEPVGEMPKESEIDGVSIDAELRELEEEFQERAEEARGVRRPRSIEEQAAAYDVDVRFDKESETWTLTRGGHSLVISKDSRVATLDGVTVFLDSPPKKSRGKWILAESDERIILGGVFEPSDRIPPIKTIVIDPGHGGSENGTKNEQLGILEKEINLDVSLRLQERLEALGYKTLLTRYDDRLVSLDERPEIAVGAKADLFVSVHFNAASNVDAQGLETYMLTPEGQPSTSGTVAGDEAIRYPGNEYDRENFELAFRIQESILSRLNRADRGVKKARFRVLKSLECPGVLVECGFVSNREESLLISTAGYRERLALALADAIEAYIANESEPSS